MSIEDVFTCATCGKLASEEYQPDVSDNREVWICRDCIAEAAVEEAAVEEDEDNDLDALLDLPMEEEYEVKPMDPEIWRAMSQEDRKVEMRQFLEAISSGESDHMKNVMSEILTIIEDPDRHCGADDDPAND